MSQHFIGDTHLTKEEIARLAVDGLKLQMEQLQEKLNKAEALLGKGTVAVNGSDPKPTPKKKAKWSAEQREAAALRMKKMWAEKRKNERAQKLKKTA